MDIDIIDLNEFNELNSVKLAMVRAAQTEKDGLVAAAEEKKLKKYLRLVRRGISRSTYYDDYCTAINEETDREIERIRENLMLQLAYEDLQSTGNENGPYRYPENPNYNLSYSERFLIVRNYYMNVTDDPSARLEAYSMDTLAREYLGQYYQTLYDLLASYV